MSLKLRARPLLAIAAVVAAVLVPATAEAGVLAADATNCDNQVFSQPFLPWADPAQYTLMPGGDFESGSAAWDLTAGAGNAAVNEPWSVTSATDSQSLALSSGSSATSPSICVGIQHPDIRFFTKASSSLASLKVEVLFLDANGNQQSLTIATLSGNTSWTAVAQTPIVANLLALLPNSETPVAFRLTALGGSWNVDDFYVDPFSRW